MSVTENTSEVSLPSTDFEAQSLENTKPNDYKKAHRLKDIFRIILKKTKPITEIENSLNGSQIRLNEENRLNFYLIWRMKSIFRIGGSN